MFDFITVVFQVELPLLEIQARSLDLYVKPQDVNQIVVVVNDNDYVADMIDCAWWGQHSDKVIIKTTSKYDLIGNGWENQQLLKLRASADATSTWAMVLDTKTWFVQALNTAKLFGANGKPNVGSVPGKPDVFVQGREFVENYYNIRMPKVIGPNGVPYMFHVSTVKDMISEFDDFDTFFQTNVRGPNCITEFFLYSGYVIKRYGNIEELYNTNYTYLFPINIAPNEVNDFELLFNKIAKYPKSVLTASIHRKTYPLLSQEQLQNWARFLSERKLICNISNTLDLLNTYIK
jgi:hypothetical protein